MPIAILKYKLPEEQSEHQFALNGIDWALVLWDLDQQLRNWGKYGHEFNNTDELIDKIRENMRELLQDRNLSFDMIE